MMVDGRVRDVSCGCRNGVVPDRGSDVDAALGLAGPCPAAAARVLTRRDPAGAGEATDGRVAVVLQRVDEHAVLGDVALDLLVAPAGERRDLHLALAGVPADDR